MSVIAPFGGFVVGRLPATVIHPRRHRNRLLTLALAVRTVDGTRSP
jgi:hypothetical protein